jgi:23S rRNA (uracil1939-C5)-methyltransferase
VTPPCPYFGRCGGCSWQQISYAEQLRQKRELVAESLRKHAGFLDPIVEPVVPSPRETRYRNRIQLHLGAGGEVGFRARRGSEVVDISDCLLAEEPLAAGIARARRDIQAGAYRPSERFELQLMPDGRLHRGPANEIGFAQVNSAQNERLVAKVVALFEECQAVAPPAGSAGSNGSASSAAASAAALGLDSIWDIYSGAGNFAFPLARRFPLARVSAVELHAGAVAAGRRRAQDEGLAGRVEFHCDSAEAWLARARPEGRTAALLDPPRAGCAPEALAALARLPLSFLVYVACHPVSLARDLRAFRERGWSLQSVAPFDMFPQTDHVEAVARLYPPNVGQPL